MVKGKFDLLDFAKPTWKMVRDSIIGIIFIISGLLLFWWTFTTENVDFAGNVLNRRFYTILSFLSISAGWAFTFTGFWRRVKWFAFVFIFLNIMFMLQGAYLSYDASNPDPNAFFVVYDAGFSDIGLGVKLIADAADTLVPIIFLVLILYQILYAGEGDEATKALMEGGVAFGFIIVYKFVDVFNLSTFIATLLPSITPMLSTFSLSLLPQTPQVIPVLAAVAA